ncbi:MAG TPA: hypothetical protein PKH39_02445 [Woeseiaceae bacterium]|nr:hypothetical protein [Woeseiaceae bacterium]
MIDSSIGSIAGDGWTISGLVSELELTDQGIRGEFRMARVEIADAGQSFDDVRMTCNRFTLTTRSIGCPDAVFTAEIPGVGRQSMSGRFVYDRYSVSADITLFAVAVADSVVRFDILARQSGVTAHFKGDRLQLAGLFALASHFNASFREYMVDGLVNLDGRVSITPGAPLQLALAADLSAAVLANDRGTIAADGVAAHIEMDMALDNGNVTFDLDARSDKGEAYIEPVYANFSEHAVSLKAENVTTSDFARYDIQQFALQQDSLLEVEGSAAVSFPADPDAPVGLDADIRLRNSSVSNLYTNVVKIPLAGTILGNLETDGRLSGSVTIDNNAMQSATLQLIDIILDDTRGRFAIYGLAGTVDWRADPGQVPGPSRLSWESGTAYNIPIGGGESHLQLGDNDIELLEALRLTTMGGALRLNQLELHNFGSDEATGVLDAELEPIQLGQLTGAFGWPAFSGTLSGELPLLTLAENTITVGGSLSARAFDGTIQLSDLRIEQPFGRVPRLQGELQLRNLDLRRLTETFSFGLIQGRLSGDVSGLEMINWQPVAMDMHFYTPENDRSQRRISQRAVENLASVGGGGAAAVLSTGFLQFFEVFAYDQIGLRCVLRDAVCAMSGAGPAKEGPQGRGYYIVKGKGVPRIDVVGFRNTVSWPRLVQQLSAITRSSGPTVN